MKRLPIFIFCFAILFMGCAPVTSAPTKESLPTKESPPTPAKEWSVIMTHSGGIMGLLRTIDISSSGRMTVTDQRSQLITITRQLSTEELARLQQEIASAGLIASAKNPPPCADCFVYDIEIHSGDQTFKMQLNDISLPDSGMESLVRSLRALMDQELNQ